MNDEVAHISDEQFKKQAEHIRKILVSSLGANGLLLRDNDVQLLISILECYLHGMMDEVES